MSPHVRPAAATGQRELTTTGVAQQAAWQAKTFPEVERVRPDVWSVPIPVPQNPIRYTLCYLLFGINELVVVDPGWDSDDGWAALMNGLTAAGAAAESVTGIVITHGHGDHHGLTARLAAASGAWIAMHPAEQPALPRHWYGTDAGRTADRVWLNEQGVPDLVAAELIYPEDTAASFATMPDPTVHLDDLDQLRLAGRTVRALWTPGHTPGHLCLHDEDNQLLLTGDHILPRISPNIGLLPHTVTPPLGPYLDSLRKLTRIGPVEVLPAHQWRFLGLDVRIEQLLEHHQQRLDEIVDVITRIGQMTVWQVTEQLTWSRGWTAVHGMQRRYAVAETLSHLVHLVGQGSLWTRLTPDGVRHFDNSTFDH